MPSRDTANKILSSVGHISKKDQVQALCNSGYSLSGAYKVLKAFSNDGVTQDGRRNNGAMRKITGTAAGGLVHDYVNATNKSTRKTAKKFNVCHKTISNTLKRYGVTCYKRKTAPFYNAEKKNDIKRALGRLYREHLIKSANGKPFIIMDDETYITQNDKIKFGGKVFYAKDLQSTPEDIRFVGLTKFPFKVGLWYAMSAQGISDYYIWKQSMAIDAHKYKIYCLEQRLVPFIEKHYSDRNCIFWPDKAPAHYAGSVLRYLESKQIPIVKRSNNPTNVPQCRPIELLHAEIKRRVFADKFHPQSVNELETRLRQIMDDLVVHAPRHCVGFDCRVRSLVDKAYRYGLLSVHK